MTRSDGLLTPTLSWDVLLVEDNPSDASLVHEAVHEKKLPLNLHHVDDGQKAVEFFAAIQEREPGWLAFVILDINVPKIDGLEVLRLTRAIKAFEDLPVVVMSSSNSVTDRERAARLNALYFHKPLSCEEFLKIGEVLEDVLNKVRSARREATGGIVWG